MFAEYDDEQMGALDCEDIEGHIDPNDEYLLKLATEFEHAKSEGLRLNQEIGKKVFPFLFFFKLAENGFGYYAHMLKSCVPVPW